MRWRPELRSLTTAVALALILGAGVAAPSGAAAQDTHLLVVVGLGGDAEYRDTFHGWATELVATAVGELGVPQGQAVYLGERPGDHPGQIQARSTAENVGVTLTSMAQTADPDDRILIVFIGHGTGQGQDVKFNLPGPDLTPGELDVMLSDFPTQTVALVNTTSSSGPFLEALSGPNRIILTATRSAQERNETQFGGFFVEALTNEGADLDKDGRVSLLEAFQYANAEVERYYGELNLLATEHAQLDDNGDGEGVSEITEETADGWLARSFWVDSRSAAAAPDSITDPVLLRLYEERAELERRVRELRAMRGEMEEARYEAELEELLLELALKAREIRERGGGG